MEKSKDEIQVSADEFERAQPPANWREQIHKLIDEVQEAEVLTEADYSIRVNALDAGE